MTVSHSFAEAFKGTIHGADFDRAFQARREATKVVWHGTEHLSAEPRGREIDIRQCIKPVRQAVC